MFYILFKYGVFLCFQGCLGDHDVVQASLKYPSDTLASTFSVLELPLGILQLKGQGPQGNLELLILLLLSKLWGYKKCTAIPSTCFGEGVGHFILEPGSVHSLG